MRGLLFAAVVAGLCLASTGAASQQTEVYFYDPHGRLQATVKAPAVGGQRQPLRLGCGRQ
jgi:hypothetical protein